MQTLEQYVAANGPLRKGTFNDAVFLMQSKLSAAGHALKPDSDFGGITRDALKDFQIANGITDAASFGVLGPWTAKLLDRIPAQIVMPEPDTALIYWFFMYGLGNASTSAGIDALAAILRAASNRFVIAPTLSWSQRAEVVAKIKRLPRTAKIMLAGNSMGANAIPMVTNACPDHTFLYIAGYDPTIFWTCPAFGRNVKHGRLFHGINWLNPIGHARYTEAFPGQIQTTNTGTIHSWIDDDIGLHKITKTDALDHARAA